MGKIIHTGNGVFVDTEPVAAPEGIEDDPNVHIYAFAFFRSLEHVRYGLFRTEGGPQDKEIDSEDVGQYGMEPLNPYWEFADAIKELEAGSEHSFEETPAVEVTSKEDYDEALDELDIAHEDGDWQGPGLYDFRDEPPSFFGTTEDMELDDMERAADDAFEFMFQGDEWEEAYKNLAAEEEDD